MARIYTLYNPGTTIWQPGQSEGLVDDTVKRRYKKTPYSYK
jgi:hypothetical protein